MKYSKIKEHNDNNCFTEDGTKYVMNHLNAKAGEKRPDGTVEPTYVTEEFTVTDNEGWVSEIKDREKTWATDQERELAHAIKSDGNAGSEDDYGNPMDNLLKLIADVSTSPEVVLGLEDEPTTHCSIDKEKAKVLLRQFIKNLKEDWQDLIQQMYYEGKEIKQIREEAIAENGDAKSNQAYSKQHIKAINSLKDQFEKAGFEVDRTPMRKRK